MEIRSDYSDRHGRLNSITLSLSLSSSFSPQPLILLLFGEYLGMDTKFEIKKIILGRILEV
jgi:hypothetical protein